MNSIIKFMMKYDVIFHIIMGFLSYLITAIILNLTLNSDYLRSWIFGYSLAGALITGLGKEIRDVISGGYFDIKDFGNTLLGGAIGMFIYLFIAI